MKTKKTSRVTQSTVEASRAQISYNKLILPSTLNFTQFVNEKNKPRKSISIFEQNLTNETQQIQIIQQQSNKYLQQDKKLKTKSTFQSEYCDLRLANVLQKIFFKKKRYCFQVLKQFFLFPDQTHSSIATISTYDPLIFGDEVIHTLVKILQTKFISNQIWAFINLKMLRFLKAAKEIEEKVSRIHQKVVRQQMQFSFGMIKKASDDYISSISKNSRFSNINSNLFTENKQIQCNVDLKTEKQKKSYLSSNIIHQKILPATKMSPSSNNSHSSTKIYTREEYERKYGQNILNTQDYQPKVIRISANDYTQRKTEEYFPSAFHRVESKSRVEKMKSQDTKNGIKKYNIIHYHERPREINKFQEKTKFKKDFINYCSDCCENCCCCIAGLPFSENCSKKESRPSFYPNNICKCDRINQTAMTENTKITNQKTAEFLYKQNQSQIKYQQLSQLSSRIQYLKFLRKLVREQQEQQKF